MHLQEGNPPPNGPPNLLCRHRNLANVTRTAVLDAHEKTSIWARAAELSAICTPVVQLLRMADSSLPCAGVWA